MFFSTRTMTNHTASRAHLRAVIAPPYTAGEPQRAPRQPGFHGAALRVVASHPPSRGLFETRSLASTDRETLTGAGSSLERRRAVVRLNRDARPQHIMDYGLQGKTALVTGASQGIGLAIAKALHREGVVLTVVGRTRPRLDQAARDIGSGGESAPVHPLVADLSLLAETDRVVAEALKLMGRIDILVNSAASSKSGAFFAQSDADIQETWTVKGMGYVRLVRAVAPHMIERRDGRIVNIVGTAARTPTADFLAGSMVNAALVNFTRGVSRELARHNVRINSISPGWTLTERLERSVAMRASAQGVPVAEALQREARGIPTGRHVSLEEVAHLTLLTVSDLCPSLTGEDIVIDGGATPSI